MAFDTEKLAQLAKPRSEAAKKRAEARKCNRGWLRLSQEIALSLHYYLRMVSMTQKEFAERLGVSAVYVGKLLKGGENLTLETICKIQNVIGQNLIITARPYICCSTNCFTKTFKFSANAVKSEKYRNLQASENECVMTAGDVA